MKLPDRLPEMPSRERVFGGTIAGVLLVVAVWHLVTPRGADREPPEPPRACADAGRQVSEWRHEAFGKTYGLAIDGCTLVSTLDYGEAACVAPTALRSVVKSVPLSWITGEFEVLVSPVTDEQNSLLLAYRDVFEVDADAVTEALAKTLETPSGEAPVPMTDLAFTLLVACDGSETRERPPYPFKVFVPGDNVEAVRATLDAL